MESIHFNAEFFTNNRRKLRTIFTGTAPIVLTANGLLQRNSDTTYTFRQDSSFWYLTGINEPDILLVMDKDKEYIILPERDHIQDVFDGSIKPEAFASVSGVETVLDYKSGRKQLENRLKRVQHIATLSAPAVYVKPHGMYTNPARASLIGWLKVVAPVAELLDLRSHLMHMRMIKQPEELTVLQAAIDITVDSFKEAKRKLSKCAYEYEVEAILTQGFRKRGANGHGYSPIVASGAASCTIHYISNSHQLAPKSLLLIDAGAELSNYNADITRTYALSSPTKRQHLVHKAVIEVHDFALANLKLGVTLREYEQKVEQFMGEKLRALSLIKSIERDAVRRYYPHATSHFLGLDTHDTGDYDRPMEANMVLTVEPGIYIPEEGIGVRIEDDVVMTHTGAKVLSKNLPANLL